MYYVTIFLNICYNIKVELFFQLPNSDINETFRNYRAGNSINELTAFLYFYNEKRIY